MTVGLLGEVKQLQALAEEQGQMLRKQNRMIEDVHVILQFKVDHSGQGQPVSSSRLEYSAFTASEAYSRRSLAHLLMPSNSMLNLRIGDLQENSISAIWEPDPGTRVPIRRVQSRLSFEEPDIHNPEQLRTAFSIKSPSQDDITSSKELLHMVDLSKIASNIKKCRQHKAASKKAQVLRSFLSALDVVDSMNLNWPLGNLTPLWGAIRIVVEITYRIVGVDSIVEDLRDIADTLPMIELAARELEDRDTWTPLVADVHSAASEYVQFAASFLQKKRMYTSYLCIISTNCSRGSCFRISHWSRHAYGHAPRAPRKV